MFAIIDIETCGAKFEFRKGRIIEICIVLHDGLQVEQVFTTLINPECYISSYFTKINGITNDMVADAPKFYEVASKIIELTENRIFVAHNVGFDYSFVREEFQSLGYMYKRETLCTVKLSRKLMPGRISYSLGHLCASIGIEIEGRHRAEGDAVATAQLFDLLLKLKTENPAYKNKGIAELMSTRIDKIKQYILNKIPETCGVYYFLDKDNNIIYIGKSNNMYNRALSHFNSKLKKGNKLLASLYNVDFILTGSELIALLLESEEIKKHKPFFNRMRKLDEFTHCIDVFTDKLGVINFKIIASEEANAPIKQFVSYRTAREQLDRWIEEYQLCLNYTGLTDGGGACFNRHIRKCEGICIGDEDVKDYNERVKKIVEQFANDQKSFLVVDKGRNEEERSIVYVENGKCLAYGYIDQYTQYSEHNELKAMLTPFKYYPDSYLILKSWLTSNHHAKIIPLKIKQPDYFD